MQNESVWKSREIIGTYKTGGREPDNDSDPPPVARRLFPNVSSVVAFRRNVVEPQHVGDGGHTESGYGGTTEPWTPPPCVRSPRLSVVDEFGLWRAEP